MLKAFPKDKRLWSRVIFHKKIDYYDLTLLLTIAYENSPKDDVAFSSDLTHAKIHWMNGEYAKAQRLFNKVKADIKWGSLIIDEFKQLQNELEIVRAERQTSIKTILLNLRGTSGYSLNSSHEINKLKMILKDEFWLGNHDVVQEVLEQAVSIASRYADFWLMKMQIEIKKGHFDTALETLNRAGGSLFVPNERVFFFLFVADLFNELGCLRKARHYLEEARSSSDMIYVEIWIALIRLELFIKEKSKAQTLLAEASKINPKSGQVWATAILMEERSKRGKKSAEALKICHDEENENKFVMLETAKLLFSQGKVTKSRKWFNKTVEKYPHFCDAWIYFCKLEKIWGTEESSRDVFIRFTQVKIESDQFWNHRNFYNYHGDIWCKSENHVDNWHLSKEELLEVIVDKIDVGDI